MSEEKTNSAMERAEKNIRIYDKTASMHFRLADYYRKLSNLENAFEIALSVALCGVTFLDVDKYPVIKQTLGLLDSTLLIGIISITLFAFTLIKQFLNHHQLFEKHNMAGKMFVQANLDLKLKKNEWMDNNTEDGMIGSYLSQLASSLNELPQIPEKKFPKLKHHHVRKVELSKFIDEHKATPWLWCRFLFLLKGLGVYKK